MAKTITAKDSAETYQTAVEQVKATGETVIVEQDGKPIVAVIPFDEYRRLAALREREQNEAWQAEQYRILKSEQVVFEQSRLELLKTHRGKYVAIHNGVLVDSDQDEHVLAKRVYAKFGYRTILMTKVTETPHVYRVNSPRLARR